MKTEFIGNRGVDQAFTDKPVGDRWPVWAEFRGERGAVTMGVIRLLEFASSDYHQVGERGLRW